MQLSLYTLLAREVSLEEAVHLAARTGYDAVDIRQHEDGAHFPLDVSAERAEEVRAMVADAGLHVSGLTTYYELGLCAPEAARAQLDGFLASMDTAASLGARYIRCSGPDLDPAFGYERIRAAFREQAAWAAVEARKRGLTITVEQHGGRLTASAGQCVDLLRGVANDNLGVVYDPGNAVREGFERPAVQVAMLGSMIKAVHVKNAMTKSAEPPQAVIPVDQVKVDEGVLNWPEIISEIKQIGFNGYITLEDFAAFSSLEEKFRYDAAFLRPLL